jgi:hypothetical protein
MLQLASIAIHLLLGTPVAAPDTIQASSCPANWTSLASSDPAYVEAAALARTLTDRGVAVMCVAPSHMTGMFEGQEGAALFRTSLGDFEALFVPVPQTFEALQIVERQEGGRFLYSFNGQPRAWPANLIDGTRPLYFIKRSNCLIVGADRDGVGRLEDIIGGHRQ